MVDMLLCHDDELEKRRLAFIYYLVPPWDDKDGGMLDLFDTDGKEILLCCFCIMAIDHVK